MMKRNYFHDDSAKATMLFLKSGLRFYWFLKENNISSANALKDMEDTLNNLKSMYPNNFIKDVEYVLNNLDRRNHKILPKYQYGVCNNLMNDDECKIFGWTKRSKNEIYLCPTCMGKGRELGKSRTIYKVRSALLMPTYIYDYYIDIRLIDSLIFDIENELRNTDKVYWDTKKSISVGYD